MFNEDYSFSQPFNHAVQQIRDYKRWAEINKGTLLTMFADLFQGYNVHNDLKTVQSYLVCGRRKLVESPQKARERWSSLQAASKDDVSVMTYDRLTAEIAIMPTDTIQ
ncbi:MAG: Shedu anti-phage system protein SduA domain-containing protein, partial [Candidatus Methylomirabilis sp.]